MKHRLRSGVLHTLPLLLLLVGTPVAAIDLTGKWRLEYTSTSVEFIDVVQTGGAVSTTLTPFAGYPSIAFTGTFDEPTLTLSLSVPGCTPPECFAGVSARVLPNGDWFDGRLVADTPPVPETMRMLASRCECFDGNTIDGDGCDASCRVEPCFTCTGMPSSCSPTGDGGACEDGSPCTSGETCSAGQCGGGGTVSPCIDLAGLFDVHTTSDFGSFDAVTTVEQYGATLLLRDAASGAAGGLGSIDFVSGALSTDLPVLYILCSGYDHASGTAAASGDGYTLAGSSSVPTPRGCPFGISFASTATRRSCGDGVATGDEVCDDGNIASGDGCDSNCTPTGCGNGITTVGEQCDDGNATGGDGCSATCVLEQCGDGTTNPAEQCDDGNVVSGDGCDATCTVEPCWSCIGQPSACATTYQPLCAQPLDPRRASLKLRQSSSDRKDFLNARSGNTGALPLVSLGDPVLGTDYDVCLFDRSAPAAQLLFGARVPAGGTCDGAPCWKTITGGFAYRSRSAAPHGIAKLRVVADRGGSGQTLVVGRRESLSASPTGLPSLPLPVPVELQVRNADNDVGCFAIEIPAAGVLRNDPVTGRFQGRGAP